VFDADVVGGGISPGLGHLEAFAQNPGHELQLDPLAALFERSESLALSGTVAVGHVHILFRAKEKAQPVGRALFL
jgi:hypothetical protein